MSDCSECWDTPCSCGYGYKDYSFERRLKLASAVLGIPSTKLRSLIDNDTDETAIIKSLIKQLRDVAEPVGSLHSWWMLISEMEIYLEAGAISKMGIKMGYKLPMDLIVDARQYLDEYHIT